MVLHPPKADSAVTPEGIARNPLKHPYGCIGVTDIQFPIQLIANPDKKSAAGGSAYG